MLASVEKENMKFVLFTPAEDKNCFTANGGKGSLHLLRASGSQQTDTLLTGSGVKCLTVSSAVNQQP